MAVYSMIKKSELEGALRLDAEYYQPEYLDVIKEISKFKIGRLKDVLDDIRYGLYVEPDYQEEGVNFLRALNLVDYGIDGEILKIKEKEIPNKKYLLNEGDILIVRSGANTGNVGIIENYLKNSTFGSYTICLRTTKINPYFLYIFFNSKFGKLQTLRLQTGMAQPNLNIPNIEEIKIPLNINKALQEEIEKMVSRAFEIKENSKSLYSQAEGLLLQELNLSFEALAKEERGWYIVNLSDIKSAHRADAEYFQPKYEKLVDAVGGRLEIKDLKEVFNFRRGVFIPTDYYTENKTPYPYIRIKELAENGGINKSEIIFISEDYIRREVDKLKTNDLVIAIIGDTIGKTNKIDKDLAGGYCSNNTGRLRIKNEWLNKFIPEYTEILFQSIFIQSQIEQKKAQTGQPKINDDEIKTIKIPVLAKPKQQKIADLVYQSHELKGEAVELLDQAKQKVEQLIETKK